MQPAEKLIYMVKKSEKLSVALQPDEQVVVFEGREPKSHMMED
jgi:hypothetical protein